MTNVATVCGTPISNTGSGHETSPSAAGATTEGPLGHGIGRPSDGRNTSIMKHENWLLYRSSRFVPIVKADANVRSLAIVSLTFGAPSPAR